MNLGLSESEEIFVILWANFDTISAHDRLRDGQHDGDNYIQRLYAMLIEFDALVRFVG